MENNPKKVGRKPLPAHLKGIRYTTRLPRDLVERLRKQPNAAKIIKEALIKILPKE